jgi:nicotinamidase-related amidase
MEIERHSLPLVTNAVLPFTLDRTHTCLLLHDLHAPFADLEHGAMLREARRRGVTREFDEYRATFALIAPVIGQVLAAFRERRIPAVYSCLGYRAGTPPSGFQTATGWCWDLDGPDGAFPAAWTPLPDESVFAKPGWGALMDPAFRQYLAERGIASVVVMGTLFEFGVRQTCGELGDSGLGALVVSDGVAALTHAANARTSGDLAHGATKLRTSGELLDLLARLDAEERVLV